MRWAKFLAFNALGAALWVATWTTLGYLSGSHINSIYNTATQYSTYLAIAAAVLILTYIGRRLIKRATRATADATNPQDGYGFGTTRGRLSGRRSLSSRSDSCRI
jgi:hypothetical protein